MTIDEKRALVAAFCSRGHLCDDCPLDGHKWDEPLLGRPLDCPSISCCTEKDLDKALALIDDFKRKPSKVSNPYWDNITKIANAQREKGLKEYGQGLEHNIAPVLDRIQHIEEELVDTLMYLEWLKESLEDV